MVATGFGSILKCFKDVQRYMVSRHKEINSIVNNIEILPLPVIII